MSQIKDFKFVDHSEVTLKGHLGSDLGIVNAARVSYGKEKNTFEEGDQKLLNYLVKHKHWSPFRHAQIQLHIKCPEFVARQLYKHVVGISSTSNSHTVDHAWNEISGRYVLLPEIYIPPSQSWRSKPKKGQSKQGSGDIIEDRQFQIKSDLLYKETVEKCFTCYKFLLENDVAFEQARMILPLSFMTEFIWTASLQAVMNVIELRTSSDAQKEIRDVANQIKEVTEQLFPKSYLAFLQSSKN